MSATPGPWKVDDLLVHSDEDKIEFIMIWGAEGHGMGRVAYAYADAGSNTREELEANARLIASAPALLEALEYALSVLESLSPSMCAMLENDILDERVDFHRMREAIRSARGE